MDGLDHVTLNARQCNKLTPFPFCGKNKSDKEEAAERVECTERGLRKNKFDI